MKRIIYILPIAIVLLGLYIVFHSIREHRRSQTAEAGTYAQTNAPPIAPTSVTMSEMDRQLTQAVFDDPSELDSTPAFMASVHAQEKLAGRPPHMERVLEDSSRHGAYLNTEHMKSIPSMAESFSDMRNDQARSPKSPQNQAAARQVVGNRKQRVRQLDYSKIEL